MQLTDLRYLLNDWARWHLTGGGYPKACTIGRALEAKRSGTFGPSVPLDVEPPRQVLEVMRAMASAADVAGMAQSVGVVRAVYLRGGKASLGDVSRELGVGMTQLKSLRLQGEAYLLAWIRARCESRAA